MRLFRRPPTPTREDLIAEAPAPAFDAPPTREQLGDMTVPQSLAAAEFYLQALHRQEDKVETLMAMVGLLAERMGYRFVRTEPRVVPGAWVLEPLTGGKMNEKPE